LQQLLDTSVPVDAAKASRRSIIRSTGTPHTAFTEVPNPTHHHLDWLIFWSILGITMHELLLFASVPEQQHHELLQQLAGLTAMQPRRRLERHLVFKAHRPPSQANTRAGGSQELQGSEVQRLSKMLTGVLFYVQVVGPVAEGDFGSPQAYDFDSQQWRLEFRDIPEAGTRSAVTARSMANATLPQGDLIPAMNAWGYR
jgi:mediator of RNA polymerase II transcription subunit 18